MAGELPSKAPPTGPSILVDGDLTIDWHLARRRSQPGVTLAWTLLDTVQVYHEPGGAFLLRKLVKGIIDALPAGGPRVTVHAVEPLTSPIQPGDPRFRHAVATWSLFPYSTERRHENEPRSWRVDELLGIDPDTVSSDRRTPAASALTIDDPISIVVLDDAGLGYREDSARWPRAITRKIDTPPWIVLKMAHPIAEGPLWKKLISDHAEHLVVVVTVDDLRLREVRISRELTWERAAADLARELARNTEIRELSLCAAVVVSFGPAGAFLIRRTADSTRPSTGSEIAFDPKVVEGDWEKIHPGRMVGYTTCPVGGIVRQMTLNMGDLNLGPGIRRGLAAMRTLHLEGYGVRGASSSLANLGLPTGLLVQQLTAEPDTYVGVPVPELSSTSTDPVTKSGAGSATESWSILQEEFGGRFDEIADEIVRRGPELVLRGIPLGRFGQLLTVDPREIESLRTIRALITDYWNDDSKPRPLSIAVFGAPGSGKSFGIEQVAVSILPGQVETLTFNLSQLSGPDSLVDAFHQIRDAGLRGRLPLVFWDEFDSNLGPNDARFGWLRHFLAPMQDGKFQHGQVTHRIGPAVFVFAGGTCFTMADFEDRVAQDTTEMKAAKGTDFASRLKGFLNVLGPDPLGKDPGNDPLFIIRRAILLRSMLGRVRPRLFAGDEGRGAIGIDSGVPRAFLHTMEYRHGARSMESIVAMSLLTGERHFGRSALPLESQLGLHVVASDFMRLVDEDRPAYDRLEVLAEAAHVAWCAAELRLGTPWRARTDEYLSRHSLLREYAGRLRTAESSLSNPNLIAYQDLPHEVKEQNRSFVRDITRKLDLVGYIMLPKRKHEASFTFPAEDLERLAEDEHERWMQLKLDSGATYGVHRDDRQNIHPSILPWRPTTPEELERRYGTERASRIGNGVLTDEDKDRDQNFIRSIPAILAIAGYTIVKLAPG
jgi:hypothetical protein